MRGLISALLTKSVAGATIAASLAGVTGVVAVGSAVAATSTMVATTAVNLRSGPGMSYSVLTVIPRGATVSATGTSGSWIRVTYNGRSGYAYGTYLRATSTTTGTTPAASGTATTTTGVNVRSGPGTSFAIVGYASRGTTLPTTGRTSGSWTEVLYSGRARWMYSAYLRAGSNASTTAVTGQVRTTANVNLRVDGYATAPVWGVLAANTVVDVTGATTASYTQILYGGRLLWIYSGYTTTATPAVPLAVVSPSLTNPYGGSIGPNGGWTPRAAWLRDQIKTRFGLTCTTYVTTSTTSEHYNGNALDCFGDVYVRRDLQAWAAQNARSLEVYYVIHEQRIWSLPRAAEGWRAMADRGSWTANHMDHVHISMQNPRNEY